jgi:hypothetical protein
MRLLSERSEDILADVHLTLLRIAYPGFRFTMHRRRHGRLRWVAVRRDILTAGVHTIVTGSLDELLAALHPPDLSYQAAARDLAEVVDLCSRPTGSSRRARPSRRAPATSGKRS